MRRAAVATRALAARVNLWTVSPTICQRLHVAPLPPRHVVSRARAGESSLSFPGAVATPSRVLQRSSRVIAEWLDAEPSERRQSARLRVAFERLASLKNAASVRRRIRPHMRRFGVMVRDERNRPKGVESDAPGHAQRPSTASEADS